MSVPDPPPLLSILIDPRPGAAEVPAGNGGIGFVMDALGITIDEKHSPLSFDSITGIALRRNPKRAHLLISKVLGKHLPQSPAIIEAAAHILAVKVRSHISAGLGEDTSDQLLQDLGQALRGFRQVARPSRPFERAEHPVAVIGYAEAAASLGACMALSLNAFYVASTRYPEARKKTYGAFQEEHSHASSHFLTPTSRTALDDEGNILVLVDDELTTGRTIMNTIRMLQTSSSRRTYIVATLADLRDEPSRESMRRFAAESGIHIIVVSLFDGELKVPASAVDSAGPALSRISSLPSAAERRADAASVDVRTYPRAAPEPRNGITDFRELNEVAAGLAETLSGLIIGRTLVLGIEEAMFLPLRVASLLQSAHHREVMFGSTTRSPAVAMDHPEYGIRDMVAYTVPEVAGDTSARFAYNLGNDFESVVIITSSPAETAKLTVPATSLLAALSRRTGHIFVMEATKNPHGLPEPLTGPEFGSYPHDDVAWLLKDLSACALEASAEDREEAVQNGGMHYAEALPIEYQPTTDYQALFTESLHRTKSSLALHVGVVAEQIHTLRFGGPVLVSLARAGTPVGVLIRRYLKAAHGIDAPHYAVSIVRGRGIDDNALTYIAARHDPASVIFVDGWTGKGAIARELAVALAAHEQRTGIHFGPELAVLADPGSSVSVYGTREDYLIPSASLNSTVSGLVSRTVLNEALIGVNDYHGAKFYAEFIGSDVSNLFVDTVSDLFTPELVGEARRAAASREASAPDWSGWAAVEKISVDYGINNINLVKPGVGETTRVLLRRVPWKVLVSSEAGADAAHILLLAASRGVPVEVVDGLPFTAVGLIHPTFTKGAVGSDGKSAA